MNQDLLLNSFKSPASIIFRGNAWTFLDVQYLDISNQQFVFGKLSKYAPEGEVEVVDVNTHSKKTQAEPNLLVASSPFVYIPNHSGLCFLRVPNIIEEHTFIRRFCEIIERTNHDFFVECDVDLVSDLKKFYAKLSSLDKVFRIQAHVSPPNPLFGPLWESLKQYLDKRNTDHLHIVEDAPEGESLNTSLKDLVLSATSELSDRQYTDPENVPIGDAAILMAADGYGKGKVKGSKEGNLVVISTSETSLSFTFDKTPDPHKLFQKALKIFEKVKEDRHMEHGE
ncbi:MAG: hypothetical protein HQL36_01135 [Alphaproteobacteria bacterium]|nr:hypothetical protein [Alphaproteobacteria bacterium]